MESYENLTELGWTAAFEASFDSLDFPDIWPARVVREDRGHFRLISEEGPQSGKITGIFRHHAQSVADYPAVGDWVAATSTDRDGLVRIHAVLSRFSAFTRKHARLENQAQVVAANVNTVVLVSGLDNDYNLRRMERYLTLAYESGAVPVILLNKTDLCDDLESRLAEVAAIAPGVPLHACSAQNEEGFEVLMHYAKPGQTLAFLGSSGVGKSTLINRLLGYDRQKVGAVRESDLKGRHTTTHRELIRLPEGGMVIDTPGMRELQLWADEKGLQNSFADIAELAAACRFRDCQHQQEPGCAVRSALEKGELDPVRFESYAKQRTELHELKERLTYGAAGAERRKWKEVSKIQKNFKKRWKK